MRSSFVSVALVSSLSLLAACDDGNAPDLENVGQVAMANLPSVTCPSGMRCALNVPYASESFPATRLDTFWTDGPKEIEPEPNCSSVLGTVYLDEPTLNEDGVTLQEADGIPDDPLDVDNYQYHINKEVRMLDVYRPANWSTRGRKVLLWVHGGAWADSTREMYSWMPTVFTGQNGWVTVVIEYRQLDQAIFKASRCPTREACTGDLEPDYMEKAAWWPDPADDVALAMSWVVKNIARYNGDPKQIYVAGQSAGGNLVSLLALNPDYASLRSSIAGVITMSPPSDLGWLAFNSDKTECQPMYRKLLSNFFSHCSPYADGTGRELCTAADYAVASPTKYIDDSQTYPPFLVMAGGPGSDAWFDGDMPCLRTDVGRFADAMPDGTVSYVDLDGYGHISEVASLQYSSAEVEPDELAYGTYEDCHEPFGMVEEGKVARNVTQSILSWVQCRNPGGC